MKNYLFNKRKFLSEYFLSNKKTILSIFTQDHNIEFSNKKYAATSSWTMLFEASKSIDCKISQTSFDHNKVGFICDNDKAQNILESVILKKLNDLLLDSDIDNEESFFETFYNFLVENRFYKKSFYNFIKKIYFVELDQLLNVD